MAELRLEATSIVQEVTDEKYKEAEAAAEDRMWKMKRAETDRRIAKADSSDMQQPDATKYEEEVLELTDEDIQVVEETKPEVIHIKKNKKNPPPSEIRRAA
jgi:hypothetical protein